MTCLIDLFRPSVGFAAVQLLEEAGCDVSVPASQTCCGQPAFNSGDAATAAAIAKQTVQAFEGFDYIVVPSGSCAGMLAKHYTALLGEPGWQSRALSFASQVYELTAFLCDVMNVDYSGRQCHATVTYHDSCSSIRELGIARQPRQLLQSLDRIETIEMEDREVCCGFGGTFSVKYPDISNAMVTQKAASVESTGADILTGADLGCLMNIAGKLAREGKAVEIRHIAEILADSRDLPAIAFADK